MSSTDPVAPGGPSALPAATGRSQIVGRIFHSAMEVLHKLIANQQVSPAEFRTAFNDLIKEVSTDIQKNPGNRHLGDVQLWTETATIYKNLSLFLANKRATIQGASAKSHTERTLFSQDKLLFGKIDAFFIYPDGIEVIDYKSGTILDGDLPKEDYANQLYFYGYLIMENFDIYPRTLTLMTKDMSSLELQGSPERSIELANRMRAVLAEYNEQIKANAGPEWLAKPNVDNCLFCEAKTSCESFWRALPKMEVPNWAHAVIGSQSAPITRSKLGGVTIELTVEEGSIKSDTLRICRIFEGRFPKLEDKMGQRLLVTNLRQVSSADPPVAEMTEHSMITQWEKQ